MSEQELGEIEETHIEETEQIPKSIVEGTQQFKLFGIYDISNIKVNDHGIRRYINFSSRLMVKSHGRIREKFGRAKINL
ncbi:MAG: hypothetical protein AABW90_04350, partial [Nanoarchaeota archaeon]